MTDSPFAQTAGNRFRGSFYRHSRNWHGYLSAVAFIALMFFSATGILLNHPEWFAGAQRPPQHLALTLSPPQLAAAVSASSMPEALVRAVREQVELRGAYSDSVIEGGSAMIRLEGVKGSSDIYVDLRSGRTELTVQESGALAAINELHRGVRSGKVWRALIDVIASVVLILSVLGYVLFFNLRFRLRTSLMLTGASVAAMVLSFVWFVP